MKNILLSGATGLIGSALLSYLDGKHRIDVISTRPDKAEVIFGAERAYYAWDDVSQRGEELLKQYDVVINLAGTPIIGRWTPQYKQQIRQSRVELTALLVEKLIAAGTPCARMINASSTYIYGYHPDIREQRHRIFDESSPVDPFGSNNFIVDVCRSWESALDPLDESKVVSLRIGVVLSARGGVLPPMVRYARLGLGGNVGTGMQPFPWVSITDATRAVSYLIDHKEIHGPVNIVAPENITQGEAGRTISKMLHRPGFLGMPAFLIRAIYGEMGIQATLNGAQVNPAVLLTSGFEFEDTSLQETVTRILQEMR